MQNSAHFSVICSLCFVIICHTFPVEELEDRADLYLHKFKFFGDDTDHGAKDIIGSNVISNVLKDIEPSIGTKYTGINFTISHLSYKISKHPRQLESKINVDKETSRELKIWKDITSLKLQQRKLDSVFSDIEFEAYKQALNTSEGSPLFQSARKEQLGSKENGSSERIDIVPNLCQDGSIDTVTRTQSGDSYVFKGDFYWKILDDTIADGYPRKIMDDWDGLEGDLDASLTGPDGKTYFFKGSHYWKFTDRKMDLGCPKLISVGFPGIPNKIDAAFVWSGNGGMYFFKGDFFWKYDASVLTPVSSADCPSPIKNWVGLPNDIDAAFQWENNQTYFFKGDVYYKYDDKNQKVMIDSHHPPYPRTTSNWWFGC